MKATSETGRLPQAGLRQKISPDHILSLSGARMNEIIGRNSARLAPIGATALAREARLASRMALEMNSLPIAMAPNSVERCAPVTSDCGTQCSLPPGVDAGTAPFLEMAISACQTLTVTEFLTDRPLALRHKYLI